MLCYIMAQVKKNESSSLTWLFIVIPHQKGNEVSHLFVDRSRFDDLYLVGLCKQQLVEIKSRLYMIFKQGRFIIAI